MSIGPDFHANAGKAVEALSELIKEQPETRDNVVETILEMTAALQTACDTVCFEISKSMRELSRASSKATRCEAVATIATTLSKEALLKKLKAAKVCADIKKLGKRFSDPLSKETRGALSIGNWLRTAFQRSNKMTSFLDELYWDEKRYIDDFRRDLSYVVLKAEEGIKSKNGASECAALRNALAKIRKDIQKRFTKLEKKAERCMDALP